MIQSLAALRLGSRAGPAATEGERYRYLLLMRFALVNIAGFAVLFVAWAQGWIATIVATDTTWICRSIFALFVVGLVLAAEKAWTISRELNALDTGRSDEPSKVLSYLHTVAGRGPETRALLAGTLRLKLSHRITPVRHIATMLVLMGLIGTIVGFIIALSGVNQDAVTDAGAIGPMIATLLHGMAMALFKTLVGSALNLWLMVDYRLLEGGVVHLLTHTIEEAERRAAA